MFCGAKLPFLFSFISYLLSGNDNLREERRTKREKRKVQKETTIFCRKLSFLFGAGGGIRTLGLLITNQLRYHCAIPAKLLLQFAMGCGII